MSPQSNLQSMKNNFKNDDNFNMCRDILNDIIETSEAIVNSYYSYNRYFEFGSNVESTSGTRTPFKVGRSGKNDARSNLNDCCFKFDSIFNRNPYIVPKETFKKLTKAAVRVVGLNQPGSVTFNRYFIADPSNFNPEGNTSGVKRQRSDENFRLANPLTDFFKIIYDVIESASRHSNTNYMKRFPLDVKRAMYANAEREIVLHETVPDNSSVSVSVKFADLQSDKTLLELETSRLTQISKRLYPNMRLFHEDLLKVIRYLIEITIESLVSYKQLSKVERNQSIEILEEKKQILHNTCQDFLQIIQALVAISQSRCLHKSAEQSDISKNGKTNLNCDDVTRDNNDELIANEKSDQIGLKSAEKQNNFPFSELTYLENLWNMLDSSSLHLINTDSFASYLTHLSSEVESKSRIENTENVTEAIDEKEEVVLVPILRSNKGSEFDVGRNSTKESHTAYSNVADVKVKRPEDKEPIMHHLDQERNVRFDEDLNEIHSLSLTSENQLLSRRRKEESIHFASDVEKNTKKGKSKKRNRKDSNEEYTSDDENENLN